MAGPQHERRIKPVRVIDFSGDVLLVECDQAVPPGSRVAFDLPGGVEPDAVCRGKLVDLRRSPSGPFEMKLRIHSATREIRAALEEISSGITVG